MDWYVYLVHFFGGMVLANGVPHFVQGISGNRFQSPFASPPGVGLSAPVVNVLWGFANLVIGWLLVGAFMDEDAGDMLDLVVIAAGVLIAAFLLAHHFGRVRAAGNR